MHYTLFIQKWTVHGRTGASGADVTPHAVLDPNSGRAHAQTRRLRTGAATVSVRMLTRDSVRVLNALVSDLYTQINALL